MRRGFVDTPDGQIHYLEEGSGDPVVLLHPSPHSSNFFYHTIPVLSPHLRVIAMDSMGYGDSDRPSPPYTEMIQYARSVTWLLDGLGIEKAHIVGFLTGAEVATEVGAAFPDRVNKLVLSEVFNWNTDSRRAVHQKLHFAFLRTSQSVRARECLQKAQGVEAPAFPLGSCGRELTFVLSF